LAKRERYIYQATKEGGGEKKKMGHLALKKSKPMAVIRGGQKGEKWEGGTGLFFPQGGRSWTEAHGSKNAPSKKKERALGFAQGERCDKPEEKAHERRSTFWRGKPLFHMYRMPDWGGKARGGGKRAHHILASGGGGVTRQSAIQEKKPRRSNKKKTMSELGEKAGQ